MTSPAAATFAKLALLSAAAVGATALAAACAGGPTTSIVTGQIAQETFTTPIGTVIATSESGAKLHAVVDADGRFSLPLVEGNVYAIQLLGEGLSVPLALSGAHGVYLTALPVTSGGAEADLGLVRMWTQEEVTPYAAELPTAPSRAPGVCEAGYFTGTSEPCIAEQAVVTLSLIHI